MADPVALAFEVVVFTWRVSVETVLLDTVAALVGLVVGTEREKLLLLAAGVGRILVRLGTCPLFDGVDGVYVVRGGV